MLVKFVIAEIKRLSHFGVWASYMSKFLLGMGIGMLLAAYYGHAGARVEMHGWILTMLGLALTTVFLIEILHQNS